MPDRAKAAQVLQIVEVDMPIVHFIAALAQEVADHILARSFGAAGRGNGDEIACGGKLRVETRIDGFEDSLLNIADGHCWMDPSVRRIKS